MIDHKIKFTKDDVGKTVCVVDKRTEKARYFKICGYQDEDNQRYAFDAARKDCASHIHFAEDGRNNVHCKILPLDHPAVKAGKLEIPIPPPPKKVVLEPGTYFIEKVSGADLRDIARLGSENLRTIKQPIVLSDGID